MCGYPSASKVKFLQSSLNRKEFMLIVKLHLNFCKQMADGAWPLGSLQVPAWGINAEGYGQDKLLFWHQSSPDQSELINTF